MKYALIVAMALIVAGCGGGKRNDGHGRTQIYTPTAHGPLRTACLASERKARSSSLCGCVQAVANQTLSASEQRRAVRFYSDPHMAQDIRQSSRPADKEFWKAYSDYGKRAERVCS